MRNFGAKGGARFRMWLVTGGGALLVVVGVVVGVAGWLSGSGSPTPHVPAAVSEADSESRVCLLGGTDATSASVWASLQQAVAEVGKTVAQRYAIPRGADPAAYVNTLVQLRCGTVIATDGTARSAVATRLTAQGAGSTRFVVIAQSPLAGATSLTPAAATPAALASLLRG